jgi:hypothetical protein
LLCAVVQIALDAPAFQLEGVEQPRPGPRHLDELDVRVVDARREDGPGHRGAGAGPGGHRISHDHRQWDAREGFSSSS